MNIPDTVQKVLLSCGFIAAFLYLVMDLLAGNLIKGYRFSIQSMSELGAAGSPTRPLVIGLTIAASAFLVAFGAGVWRVAGAAALPRIVAALIIGNAITGLVSTLFFPNSYGMQPKFGTPGVQLMFISVLCFVLAMVFGAAAFHGWMRILSVAIPAAYVVLGILRFALAASFNSQDLVLIGSQERTMAYSFLVWVAGLAVYLLR